MTHMRYWAMTFAVAIGGAFVAIERFAFAPSTAAWIAFAVAAAAVVLSLAAALVALLRDNHHPPTRHRNQRHHAFVAALAGPHRVRSRRGVHRCQHLHLAAGHRRASGSAQDSRASHWWRRSCTSYRASGSATSSGSHRRTSANWPRSTADTNSQLGGAPLRCPSRCS